MKRLVSILAVLALLLTVPAALAHEVPEERSDCSIRVQVYYDGEPVDGGTLTAIRVGYVDEDDGNYFFSRCMDDLRLDSFDSPEEVAALKAFYEQNRGSYAFETASAQVSQGEAVFEGLQTGLYLIIQEEAAEGFTALDAFLVTVPYLYDGIYVYDVDAVVKPELTREPDDSSTETSEPTEPTESTEPSDPTEPTEPGTPDLPQTGMLNWPIPVLGASGIFLVLLGILLLRRKENYEA